MKKQKDFLRFSAEAPAEFLDRSVLATQQLTNGLQTGKVMQKTEDYWHMRRAGPDDRGFRR